MLSFLRHIFSALVSHAPQPKSALTAQQASAIAETAVIGTHHAGNMWMSRLDTFNGQRVWIVGSASKGSGITVIIDDATGNIVSCKPWGVR